MSMLAGPKRKQKWTLNPRGKSWSEDSNKFGQKMLEKMGWSSGKGLGPNGQGMVEHIRVKVKNDQVGIGYDKNRDDQWTEHQEDFDSFLQNLQKEQSMEKKDNTEDNNKVLSGISLEEKSKLSQKRVHYKKFTRGKDVNKYSTKDLANIFGKRDLNDKSNKEKLEEEEEEYDACGTKDTTAGILTIKAGNMNDYFKLKTGHNFCSTQNNDNSDDQIEKCIGFGYQDKSKSKFYINDDNDDENDDSDSESKKYSGFGFSKNTESKGKNKKMNNLNYVFDNPCLDLNILDDDPPLPRKIKTENINLGCTSVTPKKRKSEFSYDNQGLDLECPDRPTPKKLKTNNVIDDYGCNGLENPGLDLEFPDRPIIKKIKKSKNSTLLNEIDNYVIDVDSYSTQTPKKSKECKENKVLSNEIENPILCTEQTQNKIKKMKKDNELLNGIENSGLDLDFPNKLVPIKAKKNKEGDILSNGIENPAMDLEYPDKPTSKSLKINIIENIRQEFSEKLTPKKLKKSKHFFNGIENPALDLECPDKITPKKSKRNKNDDDISNGIENPALDLECQDKITPKKSKKNKNDDDLSNGIENPALDLEYTDKVTSKKSKKNKNNDVLTNGIENPALDLECPDRVTPKKVKKRIDSGVENPALDLNLPVNIISNRNFEVSRNIGLENNALDLSDESTSKRRVTFNDEVEYSNDTVKKKKKKLDKYEVVNDKFKKNSKSVEPVTFVNEGLDLEIINEEEIDNELNERKSKKCKRKKERRISSLETIEEAPEEETINVSQVVLNKEPDSDIIVIDELSRDIQEIPIQNSSKKKLKKRKQQKNNDKTIESEKKDITVIDISETSSTAIVKKKKKSESSVNVVDNIKPNDVETESICNQEESSFRKKKKKKLSDDDVISLEEFLNEEPKSVSIKPVSKFENIVVEQETIVEEEIATDSSELNSYQKFKKSKKVAKSIFIKNPTLLFNGSNINDMKGYGLHLYNNY